MFRRLDLIIVALFGAFSIGWFVFGAILSKPQPTIIKVLYYKNGKLTHTDVTMNDSEKYKECEK
jgi:hypothetical protein